MNRYLLYNFQNEFLGSYHCKWHCYDAAKSRGLRHGEFYVVDLWEKVAPVS